MGFLGRVDPTARHGRTQAGRRDFDRKNRSLSLVFVGILAEHKGVHTAIEALDRLSAEERQHVRLTILGTGHRQYEERLHNLVIQLQLSDYISFQAPILRSALPDFLGKFDVLLLPSIWSEPLARIMQEGLASGMVVVGSANGGTAETISHGENGLLFAPGDAVRRQRPTSSRAASRRSRSLGSPSSP